MVQCELCAIPIEAGRPRECSPNTLKAAVLNGMGLGGPLSLRCVVLGGGKAQEWAEHNFGKKRGHRFLLCARCEKKVNSFAGPPNQKRRFYGRTVDEATSLARDSGIDPEDMVSVTVSSEPQVHQVSADGADSALALAFANAKVPRRAFDLGEPAFSSGASGIDEVHASSETQAVEQWQMQPSSRDLRIVGVTRSIPPRPGVLGLGRRPGTWLISWSGRVSATIKCTLPAVVIVEYRG